MVKTRGIIVDLSGAVARVGVAHGSSAVITAPDLIVPWRVAVRREQEELLTLAGEETADISEDALTLVFDHLHYDLPRIKDAELQSLILRGFWSALCGSLARRGLVGGGARNVGYVIAPHLYPVDLLERFRSLCARENGVKLTGFFHEAAALVMGFLRSEYFSPEPGLHKLPIPLCLVVAHNSKEVEVTCFDYSRTSRTSHRVVIRDFFKSSCENLGGRLQSAEWLGELSGFFSGLTVLERPDLTPQARAALEEALRPLYQALRQNRAQTNEVDVLKIRGGAYLAGSCLGQLKAEDEYSIETAYHIGIQVSQDRFYPVAPKDELVRLTEFPYTAKRAFKLRGWPGSELLVNLYCGYSNHVDEALLLGSAVLAHQDLAGLAASAPAHIAAVLHLSAPGSGDFTLRLWQSNKEVAHTQFTLPGLVV